MKATNLLSTLACASLVAGSASAATVAISNHSFEDNFDDWTTSGAILIKTPPADNLGAAPDGSKVAFNFAADRTASQVLTTNLAANTKYTLQMDFLTRTDGEGLIDSFLALGYGAGGLASGTELARIVNTDSGAVLPTPGTGGFGTWTLTFTTAEVAPAGEGQVLWVALGTPAVTTGGSAGYDNVRLDATLVPEPGSLALLGLGGLLIASRRRRG